MQFKIQILPLILLIPILASKGFTQNQGDGAPKVLKVIVIGSDTTNISYLGSSIDSSALGTPKEKLKQKKQEIKPASIVTGSVSGAYDYDGGLKQFLVVVNPVMLAPIGDKLFFQASVEMEGTIAKEGEEDFTQEWETKVEFLHLDYFASKNLTIVGGAFLTPFGIYNERLDPRWIRNVQNEPFSHDLMPETELGLMLRGGVKLSKELNLNYAGYYSFQPSPGFWIEAQRGVGGRISLFHLPVGIEAGFSAYRKLVDEQNNLWGLDLSFKYPRFPLGIKSEFLNAPEAKTYWAEFNYRFNNLPNAPAIITNAQLAARFEQLFTTDEGTDEGLSNLNRLIVALNYYIIDGLKLSFEFGKTFNQDINTNTNLFTIGLVFRPVL